MRRFRYDAKHDILKCPKGRFLRPERPLKYGRFFYSRAMILSDIDGRPACSA